MKIQRTAIVGAGAMGGGIAYVLSFAGLPVLIKDIDSKQLDLAREHLEGIYQRRVDRGRLSAAAMQERLSLIQYTLSYDRFDSMDLVIEAVPENIEIKRAVMAELSKACHTETILASNTSALSISEMGAASGRSGYVVGMHFFNPAHVMRLVEVVPSLETDSHVVQTVFDLATTLGKTPVVVRECPGFLVNRLLMPYLNEAVFCLQEGAASIAEIDAAMGQGGFGWPMGPFVLMDMLGLDVCHHIVSYLDSAYGDRMQEATLLEALYDAGRLGEKQGRGFYDHPGHRRSPGVDALVLSLRAGGQVAHPGSAFSVDRLMSILLNEAFACVEEEIASVADIDLACVAGLGMAVQVEGELVQMGPLAYADQVGLDTVLAQLQAFERVYGHRFRSASVLRQKVRAGDLGKASGRGFRVYSSEGCDG